MNVEDIIAHCDNVNELSPAEDASIPQDDDDED